MNAKVTDMSAFRLKKTISGERRVGIQDAFQVPDAHSATSADSADFELEFGSFASNNDEEATVPNYKETLQDLLPVTFGTESVTTEKTAVLHFEKSNQDLAERIERLKSSINRINALMDELRGGPESRKN